MKNDIAELQKNNLKVSQNFYKTGNSIGNIPKNIIAEADTVAIIMKPL